MQMAIDVAGFTPAESDELRQAMGSKRSAARMERLGERLYGGMAERGITGEIADQIFTKMRRSPTTASPSRTRCRSPTSCMPRRGSSTTSPRRSARPCSTPSRWGSGARTPWSATPAATASRSAAPTEQVVGDVDFGTGLTLRTPVQTSPRRAQRIGAALCHPAWVAGATRGGQGDSRRDRAAAHRGRAVSRSRGPRPPCPGADPAPPRDDGHRRSVRGALGLDRRRALWAAGAVAQSRPGRLAGIVTGASAPQLR